NLQIAWIAQHRCPRRNTHRGLTAKRQDAVGFRTDLRALRQERDMSRTDDDSGGSKPVREPDSQALPAKRGPHNHPNRLILDDWRSRKVGKRERCVHGVAPSAYPVPSTLGGFSLGTKTQYDGYDDR